MTVGIFAVIGVVLGSLSTYLVQNLMAGRAEDFAVRERHRRDGVDVCSAFAAEAMNARRSQIHRWYEGRDAGFESASFVEAKAESYRTRSATRRERYRVQLVADNVALTEAAEAVVVSLGHIHKAPDEATMEALADSTRELVESFVGLATTHLSDHGHGAGT
ncbi:MAG: hypothetical protein ABF306_07420 [Nocardioides marinisabuli]|uniref:hypothetical protein n=1 Tax=Nocardioides marinisabuli TaxID=419476 RepID=UPI00321B4A13